MTVSQLYSLYCAGHAEARSLAGSGSPVGLLVSGAGITALERLILELALLDATNGTALRSRREFERALEHGADVLSALGLAMDRGGDREEIVSDAPAPALEEAA